MRAYRQMQTNAKYASIARPSAKLFHSVLSLELQAQREARLVANEQSVSELNFSCRAQELGRCPPLASRNSAPRSAKCMSSQSTQPGGWAGRHARPPTHQREQGLGLLPREPHPPGGTEDRGLGAMPHSQILLSARSPVDRESAGRGCAWVTRKQVGSSQSNLAGVG